jgi:hypothetical protein
MDRRDFLKHAGIVSATAAAVPGHASAEAGENATVSKTYQPTPWNFKTSQGPRTLLFFDYYPLMRCNNVSIKQSTAQYIPEGDFADPVSGSTGGGSVFFHQPSGMYRKIYGCPETRVYESENAIQWRPSPQPGAHPVGGQNGSNHVHTSPHKAWGGNVLYHPEAGDGYPYKMIVLELHESTYDYALETPAYWLHEQAKKVAARGGITKAGGRNVFPGRKHSMLVSRDGIDWEFRRDYDWGYPPAIIEEHYQMHFNHHSGQYVVTSRPSWGDRRIYRVLSADCQHWSRPELLLHPDVHDEGRIELHGSAVCRYDSYYISLLWISNYTSSVPTHYSGQGMDHIQLAYSYNGTNFIRGLRQPLIPNRQSGQPDFGSIWARGMIVKGDEILIYSDAKDSQVSLFRGEEKDALKRAGKQKPRRAKKSVIHKLRKDGFTYLESNGYFGEFQTQMFTLFDGKITINADAKIGAVYYAVDGNVPVAVKEKYSLENCVPLIVDDQIDFQLRWKDAQDLSELVGQQFYLKFKMKGARFYAIRADFNFDLEDRFRISSGLPMAVPSYLF